MISGQLEKFAWKKDTLANCRCPICGDSEKNRNKCRGYFFVKKNNFFYKCHNCGVGHNLYNFLKDISPSLCKEYSLEEYRDKNGSNDKSKREKELFGFLEKQPVFKRKDKLLNLLKCLNDLPDDHIAVKFANMRLIPKQYWKLLYYTDDFGNFVQNLDPSCFIGKEERLVIPFFNSHGDVVACQGRALNMRETKVLIDCGMVFGEQIQRKEFM